MNVSRVNAFRATVDRHCELANRILLTSKEIAERRGQVDVAFTSFFIVPEDKYADRFLSSQDTKRTVLEVLKLARYAFKINKIAYAPNKGIRIEANKSDLVKLKSCSELAEANDIKNEVIAQNFDGVADHELKIKYMSNKRRGIIGSSQAAFWKYHRSSEEFY
ncbi:hypothetical protein ALC60_02509 [Trachymyrmex zeteki]|uniref:Uncharacterized protein n=1 Tax=Mycetomoellerius zeteki TaxID=64791 RepID=A0A151XDM0_9HYME|nr:hypothetical protein ALC60_02509 [Trachymyrmex zeteki]